MSDIYLKVFDVEVPSKNKMLVDEPVNEDLLRKNKYANNSSYVPDSVYRRLLNKISNYQWSFVPHTVEDKNDYVQYVGLLIVPGFGVHTGIGSAKKNKKDNSNTLAAAKTYAFKNACKEMGLAPNIGDEDFDEDLFENDIDLKDEPEEKKPKQKESSSKKKSGGKEKKKPSSLKDRIEEIRQAYELDEDDDFVAFIQIWDEDILDLTDLEDEDWEEFLDYLESHKDKFEDF